MRKFAYALGLLALTMVMTGCEQRIVEDKYPSIMKLTGNSEVHFDTLPNIFIDVPNKTITITGVRSNGNSNSAATKVKVVGDDFKYKIFDCERVVVDSGVEAWVTNCAEVNVQEKGTVHVASCPKVNLMPNANVADHNGAGEVNKIGAKAPAK